MNQHKKNLALFASGKGSNAKNIIDFFRDSKKICIALIVSSHREAGVLQIGKEAGIPTYVLDRKEYYGTGESLLKILLKYKIEGIVLAGFIWLIPAYLIDLYPRQIINIHPALLPKYGGKGMYGMKVHEAVWSNKEKTTAITIHEVNKKYDEGTIIHQATCTLDSSDTPFDIAHKVHELEYQWFPVVIQNYFS